MKVKRLLKLTANVLISSLVFCFFITALIILLNPGIDMNILSEPGAYLTLFLNIFTYYGPIWLIISTVIFLILQFFSEKKFNIGFFSPPSLTYFLGATVFITSLVFYFNYDYYIKFFSPEIKDIFSTILMIDLILLTLALLFVFSSPSIRKWTQIAFLTTLLYSIVSTSITILSPFAAQSSPPDTTRNTLLNNTPRKIRLIIMNGLSQNYIKEMGATQKLRNFNHLLNNGARSTIKTFSPNFNLGLLNSMLSGQKPNLYFEHSHYKYKLPNINYEFDNFPRYIFFRYSSYFGLTVFYQKKDSPLRDHIQLHYSNAANNNTSAYKTINMINNENPPYFRKTLQKNSLFIKFFSETLKKEDTKFEILKKAFYLDDYQKLRIPDLKSSDLYYTAMQFHGMNKIKKHFYQYFYPSVFGNISKEELDKYQWIREQYYEYYDSIIGQLITTTGDDEMLVIISLYHYEPMPIWRRILAGLMGSEDIYVYKHRESRGTIFLYEKNAIKRDYPAEEISIYDIYPTLLYYAGYQLTKDTTGEVIREVFNDDFLLNNPIDIETN